MRKPLPRTLLTVTQRDGVWRVEPDNEGEAFGHSADKDETRAAASRRAREMIDAGVPCQVHVQGERRVVA